jgi:hypothetical protein
MAIERIRFDDILWATGDPKVKGKELQKFKKHINWCKDIDVPLAPAILCQDIEQFPECVQYIKEQTGEGVMHPDLHGWTHGPYGDLSEEEVSEHLDKALTWFDANLGVMPIRFITPHGANSHAIQAAAQEFGLIVEDTSYPVIDQKAADSQLRETGDVSILDDRVLMVHFWEKGLRLFRIAKIIQFGNISEAIEASKVDLNEKEFKICWSPEWLKWQ